MTPQPRMENPLAVTSGEGAVAEFQSTNALNNKANQKAGEAEVRNLFAENAPRYWAAGLPAIPLWKNKKNPSILAWEQFGTRMPTPEEQREWMLTFPDGNIGLPMGSASGLVGLDIDNDAIVDLVDKVAGWSPWERVGKKGKMVAFKFSGQKTFRIKDAAGNTLVELLSEGAQIVLPPSIHPDTRQPYEANCDLVDVLSTVPSLPDGMETRLRTALIEAGMQLSGGRTERFNLPTTVNEGSRHPTMVSYAGQLRAAGMAPELMTPFLLTVNEERFNPPLEARVVEKIVAWFQDKDSQVDTELDAAAEFAGLEGGHHRFGGGVWWHRRGGLWKQDGDGAVSRAAKAFVRGLEAKARAQANEMEDKKLAASVIAKAKTFQSEKRIKSVINLARTEEACLINPAKIDSNPMLFAVANGVVDLTTGQIRDIGTDDLLSRQSPVWADPDARCPLWERTISDIFLCDEEMVAYVQRALGYALTGDTREQAFFLQVGSGGNGKSVLMETVARVAGDYATAVNRDVLIQPPRLASAGAATPHLMSLMGARLGQASETERNLKFNTEAIKQIAGDDTVVGRRLHENEVRFQPVVKLFLRCNSKPEFDGADYAFVRRVHLWQFEADFTKSRKRDLTLKERLACEDPGILNWLIRGCLEWQRLGLRPPTKVMQAVQDYAATQDRVGGFLNELCVVSPEKSSRRSWIYEAYSGWARTQGFIPANVTQFTSDLAKKGITFKDKHAGGYPYLFGVCLKSLEGLELTPGFKG